MSKYMDFVFFFFLICVASLFKSSESTGCITNSLLGNETKEVNLANKCTIFVYENEVVPKTSISRIVVKATSENNTSKEAFLTVTIEEYENNKEQLASKWAINSNEKVKKSYFSENKKLTIKFETTGDWMNNKVSLSHEEIKFETFELHSSKVNSTEIFPWDYFDDDMYYRPNSDYIFYIEKNKSLSSSNIQVTLNELEIDKEIGEYLLIGAGAEPHDEGPSFLCITDAVGKKKYLVDDETAYIKFVTKATNKNFRGFNISWEYKGNIYRVFRNDPTRPTYLEP